MAVGARPARKQNASGIFCVESWSGDLRTRRSVRPLLEILEQEAGLRFIHRIVDSRAALFELLARWPSYRGYRLGYVACHGSERELNIGADRVRLDEIEKLVKEREIDLRRRTLYFGSCSVLCMPAAEVAAFREAIGAEAVCGYRGEDGVGWLESGAFELLLFDYLTYRYKQSPFGLRDLKRDYPGLCRKLEFVADPVAG